MQHKLACGSRKNMHAAVVYSQRLQVLGNPPPTPLPTSTTDSRTEGTCARLAKDLLPFSPPPNKQHCIGDGENSKANHSVHKYRFFFAPPMTDGFPLLDTHFFVSIHSVYYSILFQQLVLCRFVMFV